MQLPNHVSIMMQNCFMLEILFCFALLHSVPMYKCWTPSSIKQGATGRHYTMWTSPGGHLAALSESYWIKYRNNFLNSQALLSSWLSHWVKLGSPLLLFAASVELYSRKNKTALTKKGKLKLQWEKEGDSKKYRDLGAVLKDIMFVFERTQTATQLTQVFHSFGGISSHRYSQLGVGRLWCLQLCCKNHFFSISKVLVSASWIVSPES